MRTKILLLFSASIIFSHVAIAQHRGDSTDFVVPDKYREFGVSIIQELVYKIFPPRLDKKFRDIYKENQNNPIEAARKFLNFLEKDKKEVEVEFFKKSPYVFTLLQVMATSDDIETQEYTDSDALLYRSIFSQLNKGDLTTKTDLYWFGFGGN